MFDYQNRQNHLLLILHVDKCPSPVLEFHDNHNIPLHKIASASPFINTKIFTKNHLISHYLFYQ